MSGKRFRFVLIEESSVSALVRAPARRRRPRTPLPDKPPRPDPMQALLEAFSMISQRGDGPHAWGTPLSVNPLAFLLDAIDESVRIVSQDGEVLFQNRAAQGVHFEQADSRLRRAMTFKARGRRIVIEVLYRPSK